MATSPPSHLSTLSSHLFKEPKKWLTAKERAYLEEYEITVSKFCKLERIPYLRLLQKNPEGKLIERRLTTVDLQNLKRAMAAMDSQRWK